MGTQGSHDNKQLLDGVEHNIMNYAEVWVNFANSASLLQIFQKMYNKTITEFGLRTILGILNTDTRFDSSRAGLNCFQVLFSATSSVVFLAARIS